MAKLINVKNNLSHALSVLIVTVILSTPLYSQSSARKHYEQFENLLARMGLRYDCYFTIEKVRATVPESSLSTFQNDGESNFQFGNSLLRDLERLRKSAPNFHYHFDRMNSKIIHVSDNRLSRLRGYVLERKLNSFAFKGRLWELPDAIGKLGLRVGSKRSGDSRDFAIMDFATLVDHKVNDLMVRDVLTTFVNFSDRGRILWIAESDLESDGFTYVWFLMGPKKN
jgi:hypothetical protein